MMMSQFFNMVSSPHFLDVVLFLLSNLVTAPSFISISSLDLELWQLRFIWDSLDIRKSEITLSELFPISGDSGKLEIPNLARMSLIKAYLLNIAKCQSYSFYRLWVIKGKATWGGGLHHPHQDQEKKCRYSCICDELLQIIHYL